jgi:hypothetical protein
MPIEVVEQIPRALLEVSILLGFGRGKGRTD